MSEKNLTTYPQMLEGEKGDGWTVVNEGIEAVIQQTDLAGRVLVVPAGDGVLERNRRVKELAGARWTPPQSLAVLARKSTVDPNCLRCAEDFRLTFNQASAAKSLFIDQLSKGVVDPELVEGFASQVEPDNPKATRMVPLVMASLGKTEGATRFRNALELKEYPEGVVGDIKRHALAAVAKLAGEVGQKANAIMQAHLRKSFAGFPKSVELAKYLMKAQAEAEAIAQSCQNEIRNAKGKRLPEVDARRLKINPEAHKIEAGEMFKHWGTLEIKVPPMVMPVKAKNKIARHRVTEEGILPFQLYRLYIDGKIFLDPRRQKGGSVLVDISGSMGLKPEQVYEFVLKCPGATIAQYSGNGGRGELVVVAHKGAIAARHHIGHTMGGNVVDGPSLEWLSKQPRPRIWVSDTQVTGVGDSSSHKLRELALAFCGKHQIKIVRRFDAKDVALALNANHRKLLAKAREDGAYA